MLCDRLATDPRPGRDRLELPVWLGKSLHEIEDLRPIYDRGEWHTRPPSDLRPTCEDLRLKEDPVGSWVTRKWNWQVPRPFVTVKSGSGACPFHWRVSPSYCEYSGVTYDLLVSYIGGTYDLVDQLPSNHEFGHFLVVSQSQVPREFDAKLAIVYLCGAPFKKKNMVKILHIVRIPHVCGEFGEFNSNVWNVIIKRPHSYQAVREWQNQKVCAAFCRRAFDLTVSNRVNLYYKRHLDCNTVGYLYNAVQHIMLLLTVLQWQQQNINQTLNSQKNT